MNQKGFAPIFIVVVILIIFLGGYYLGQQKIKPTPTPPQSTIASSPNPEASPVPTGTGETANWKTYTNTEYGYAIKYPPVWSYIACSPATRFDTEPWYSCATDAPGIFSISVFDKMPETPLISIGKESKVISKNLVSIGGTQGERVVTEKVEPAPGADKIIVAAVEYKGKIYTFNLQDINEQVVFDQILSTFKFIE